MNNSIYCIICNALLLKNLVGISEESFVKSPCHYFMTTLLTPTNQESAMADVNASNLVLNIKLCNTI